VDRRVLPRTITYGDTTYYTRIKLAQHRSDYNDDLDMKLNGPSLFMRVRL
jgi:hypothetical protein